MWHRIRIDGGSTEAMSEQNRTLREMSSWAFDRAMALCQSRNAARDRPSRDLLTPRGRCDRVWHLNEMSLTLYRAIGRRRPVEPVVGDVPSEISGSSV